MVLPQALQVQISSYLPFPGIQWLLLSLRMKLELFTLTYKYGDLLSQHYEQHPFLSQMCLSLDDKLRGLLIKQLALHVPSSAPVPRLFSSAHSSSHATLQPARAVP